MQTFSQTPLGEAMHDEIVSTVKPELAALIVASEELGTGGPLRDKWRAQRALFSSFVQTPEWSFTPLSYLLPGLNEVENQYIKYPFWHSWGLSPKREEIYTHMVNHFRYKTRILLWAETGMRSFDFLTYDIGDGTHRKYVAEMLFDVCIKRDVIAELEQPPMPGLSSFIWNAPVPDVAALIGELMGYINPRDFDVLVQHQSSHEPRTLPGIGASQEISPEHVREIRERTVASLNELLRSMQRYAIVVEKAQKFSALAGPIFPDQLALISSLINKSFGTEMSQDHTEILLLIAGPYSLVGNYWINTNQWDDSSLQRDLKAFLRAGNDTHEDVVSVYLAHGVREEFIDELIAEHPHLVRVLNKYVWGQQTERNSVVATLERSGVPMTLDELGSILKNVSRRSLIDAIAESERIHKIDIEHYGLVSWGFREYTSISDAIVDEIEDAGGIADLAQVIDRVTSRSGARVSSVRGNTRAPRFVIQGDSIRLRRKNEPYQPDGKLLRTRPTVFVHADKTSVRIKCTREDLRGSGRSIPDDLVFHLRGDLNKRISYAGNGFTLNISRPDTAVDLGTIGGLRELLSKLGAKLGDEIRLDFYVEHRLVRGYLVNNAALARMHPQERIKLLTGVTEYSYENIVAALDTALGYPIAGVKAMLRARGNTRTLKALMELERISG